MGPLSGMRVVDLADVRGELCGRVLADLGADVVRVEPPGGASSRRLAPFAPDGKTSLYFAFRNAGKRGATLDLADGADRRRLGEWLDDADLLIESFAPGRMAELGLAPDTLVERHPQLCVVSISDFGQTGPYRDWRGTDLVSFAMGGMMHRAGSPEKPPVAAPGSFAYDVAGVTAAYAGLLGFWKRLATGRGQHLDVSAMESVANVSDWSLSNYSINPSVGMRAGAGIYTVYRCADGYVRMIVLVKHHWHALLDWVGHPEALADPALEQFIARLGRMTEIAAALEDFFRDKPKIEVAREAQRRGIACTPLLQPGEVLDNEHTRARGTFRMLPVGGGFEAQVASGFWNLDGERAGPRAGPPEAGAEFDGFGATDDAREALLAGSGSAATGSGGPLEGLRVVDCGIGGVGVEVGRLLAEYGADVIKVESRLAPDFIRTILSSWMNPCFASSSRSKRCLGVSLKDLRGVELVKQLVAQADVLIENSANGVFERLGLGADAVRQVNPQLVYFKSQLLGSSGPWQGWLGYGPNTHPVSGLHYLWNYPEDAERPAGSTTTHPDHFVGRAGAVATLAGLLGRRRTGRGVVADAAQFEVALQLLGDLLAAESLAPGSVHPSGNAHPEHAPWGCYPCSGDDDWCVICVGDDAQWRALRGAMGDPEWALDPALDGAAGRVAQRVAIDARLAAWSAEHPQRKLVETLQGAGVAAGIVMHGGHHLDDPHLAARGYPQPLEQPPIGMLVLEGPAFRGSDLPPPRVEPAPLIGEHTREIARNELGLAEAEIDALLADGVLEEPSDDPPSNQ
jgi:crotonobetainyl-CoA:carnitine CoA-transferase CaiB-like acyl-CoA transferase